MRLPGSDGCRSQELLPRDALADGAAGHREVDLWAGESFIREFNVASLEANGRVEALG